MSFGSQVNTDYLTTLQAVTRDQILKKVEDNIFDRNAALYAIRDKSQVSILSSGRNIVVPVMVSENSTTDSMTFYDEIDTSPQKGIVDGTLPHAYYATSIVVSRQEEKENNGEEQVASLLASKVMQAEESGLARITTDLYLDGTGNSSKNMTGLLAMIPTSSTAGTYMGIDGDTITSWTHQYKAGATASTVALLDQLFYAIADGSDRPDLVLTGPLGFTNYELYNRQSGIGVAYTNTKMADAGFTSVAYKGIPMVLDQNHPEYTAATYPIYHMLSSKYLGFSFDQEMTPFREPVNQLAKVAHHVIDCQLVTSNRRRQGKLAITS